MVRIYKHPPPRGVTLERVLFALSDPARMNIVRILAVQGAVNSLALAPNMPRSTVAHHTRILREAGVTHTKPDGRNCWIHLRRDLLDKKFPGLLDAVLAVRPSV